MFQIKRVYEAPVEGDGFRILVDRVWPRGLSKAKAQVDLWLKAIAPSKELRQWFGHDPEKWERFKALYEAELREKQALVDEIRAYEQKEGVVTLVFSAKDTARNNAVVLRDYLSRPDVG